MSRSPRRPLVAVDARMVDASGIGTYLQNVLRRLVATAPEWDLALLADPEALARHGWGRARGVELLAHRAPFYGLRQQLLPMPSGLALTGNTPSASNSMIQGLTSRS